MPLFPKQEEFDDTHSFAETVRRYPNDLSLRCLGFQIVSRPRHGEPLWRFKGELYTESRALAYLDAVDAEHTQGVVR